MYLRYYGLNEPPFSITPDPRFVHLSERHRDALAHLLFGIDKGGGGGFVQLTGEVGTGKTTLSRLLLEQLPAHARIALVLNPKQNAIELLETICEELRIDIATKRGSAKGLIDALNAYLLNAYAQGLRVVVLIDEAQNLPADTLEQVRLLTNLETDTQKLLQILLLGQPELRSQLARPELRQLAQRITARYHLQPLDMRETDAYLRHRWRVAGGTRFPFDAKAVQRLHLRSGGVPRLLNVIAERALLAGYARDAVGIGKPLIDLAADEVLPPKMQPQHWRWVAVAAGAAAMATLGFAALQWRSSAQAAKPMAPLTASPVTSPTTSPTTSPAMPPATPPASVNAANTRLPATATPAMLDAASFAQHITAAGNQPVLGWQQLLTLWKLPASSITVAPTGGCTAGTRADVHCVQGRARLEILTALDRPLLLRLQAAGNRYAWAVLLGADARNVRLHMGQREIQIDRSVLLAHWNGEYAALWVGQGALPATPELISAFQNARGLPADGVAGSLTLMALANGLPGPHLLRVLE